MAKATSSSHPARAAQPATAPARRPRPDNSGEVPGRARKTTEPTKGIKVRAVSMGYYNEKRRREGDVFMIADEKDFSDSQVERGDGHWGWMEKVDPETPERTTESGEALKQKNEELRAMKHPDAIE